MTENDLDDFGGYSYLLLKVLRHFMSLPSSAHFFFVGYGHDTMRRRLAFELLLWLSDCSAFAKLHSQKL